MAKQLGVSLSTLKRWGKQGCPLRKGVAPVLNWRAKQAATATPPTPAAAADSETLRDRLLRAQAEHYETKTRLAELEHKVKTGNLVELAAVEDLLRKWYGPVWNAIKTIDARLAHQVNPSDPEHARKILRAEIAALCKLGSDIIMEVGP